MTCPIRWQKEQSGEIYGGKPLTLKIGVTKISWWFSSLSMRFILEERPLCSPSKVFLFKNCSNSSNQFLNWKFSVSKAHGLNN
jgi:hypothetical protein